MAAFTDKNRIEQGTVLDTCRRTHHTSILPDRLKRRLRATLQQLLHVRVEQITVKTNGVAARLVADVAQLPVSKRGVRYCQNGKQNLPLQVIRPFDIQTDPLRKMQFSTSVLLEKKQFGKSTQFLKVVVETQEGRQMSSPK